MGINTGLAMGFAAMVIAACGGADEREESAGPDPTSLGSLSGATDDGDDDADTGALDDGDGTGPTFDVGSGADGVPGDDEGCQKIDFLFVIDNSQSMEDKQAQLVGAFPGFIDTIEQTTSGGSDVHILVADTDNWGKCSPGDCAAEECDDPVAGNYVCEAAFDACDKTIGAGVVHPAGRFATNGLCTPFGGNRYLVADEPDLVGTFACMATVGVAGNGAERPMDSLVAAVSPELNGAGGCNDGFLRDDAILVITFISDDPWGEDHDGPAQWYDAVVTAKGGDPSSVVVLGVTPAWDGCRDGDGPPKGEHWKEFVELWGDHGLHGNVCSDSAEFVGFFEQAVSIIASTCDEFVPPG